MKKQEPDVTEVFSVVQEYQTDKKLQENDIGMNGFIHFYLKRAGQLDRLYSWS